MAVLVGIATDTSLTSDFLTKRAEKISITQTLVEQSIVLGIVGNRRSANGALLLFGIALGFVLPLLHLFVAGSPGLAVAAHGSFVGCTGILNALCFLPLFLPRQVQFYIKQRAALKPQHSN